MLLRLASILACFFSYRIDAAPDTVGSTGCTASACVLANARLRFGTGAENSVNNWGSFQQPWYFSPSASQWYKLTFNNYPLDTAIGTGTNGPNWSGTTVVDLYTQTPSNPVTDYSNFVVGGSDASKTTGYGKIVSSRTFTILGQQIILQNTFSLGVNDSFVKIITQVTNNATAPVQNMMVWVGTRDDYVGMTDVNTKTRGNLVAGNFTPVTANNQSSRAIMITNTNEGVLFYSETAGVMTSYALCCSFSNVYNTYPLTLAPATPNPTDGSYAAVLPIGNVTVGGSSSITWYYAAGAVTSLADVAQSVAVAQVADASPTSTPSETPTASYTAPATPSNSPTQSSTGTGTSSQTPTASYTAPATQSKTSSRTPTGTGTPTGTISPTTTQTLSASPAPAPVPQVSAQPVYIVNIPSKDSGAVDPMIYLYVFLPINVLLLCVCCIGVGALLCKRRAHSEEVKKVATLQFREAWAP
jgi:hypothetical protein